MQQLEQQSNIALKWFKGNNMKMNAGKYHLFVSGNKNEIPSNRRRRIDVL